jgi:hypothetical protein
LSKEVLHGAGGLEENKHLARTIADLGKSMRDLAGRKGSIAGSQAERIFAYLDNKLSGDDVKLFILSMMNMQGRPALLMAVRIIDQQLSTRVFRRYLAIELPTHYQKLFLPAVFMAFHHETFFWLGALGRLSLCGKGRSHKRELKK